MIALASLSVRDRLDGLAVLGLRVYLDDTGQLRARGPQLLVQAARPALRLHRDALLAYLRTIAAVDEFGPRQHGTSSQ